MRESRDWPCQSSPKLSLKMLLHCVGLYRVWQRQLSHYSGQENGAVKKNGAINKDALNLKHVILILIPGIAYAGANFWFSFSHCQIISTKFFYVGSFREGKKKQKTKNRLWSQAQPRVLHPLHFSCLSLCLWNGLTRVILASRIVLERSQIVCMCVSSTILIPL